jgi:hypothetical protein
MATPSSFAFSFQLLPCVFGSPSLALVKVVFLPGIRFYAIFLAANAESHQLGLSKKSFISYLENFCVLLASTEQKPGGWWGEKQSGGGTNPSVCGVTLG